ncbi:hypothetical protein D3C87_2104560 [compost metagenome]
MVLGKFGLKLVEDSIKKECILRIEHGDRLSENLAMTNFFTKPLFIVEGVHDWVK